MGDKNDYSCRSDALLPKNVLAVYSQTHMTNNHAHTGFCANGIFVVLILGKAVQQLHGTGSRNYVMVSVPLTFKGDIF